MIDHQKNLLILENLDYIKKFYDVDENKESYSVTETGIKALIAWSKIHGFEDKLGVVMAYPDPISDDEMGVIFSDFKKHKFITKIWNAKLQSEDYPPSAVLIRYSTPRPLFLRGVESARSKSGEANFSCSFQKVSNKLRKY